MNWKDWIREKLNPAQQIILQEQGHNIGSEANVNYTKAFDALEVVNRGVNMIVSGCASLDFDVKEKLIEGVVGGVRQKTLNNLLNYAPNPYQSMHDFRVNIFTDFILEGNIFLYYDGVYLYHLPAASVIIEPDPKTYIKKYTYNSVIDFKPSEIIHIKELNSTSIYRGTSRLIAADRNIRILGKMQSFQEQFFDNGAVSGLIITTENTMSQIAKDKTIFNWMTKWSSKNGAKRPMILDSGMKPYGSLTDSFKEMDFDTSIHTHDVKILKALGVPPILLDGGNNANISPNLRLFYLETIMPIVLRFSSAFERYFGYDLSPITSNVSALQPELKEVASYHSTLVNAGILSANEARTELRYATIAGNDNLRIPANITGSASDPSKGGAPSKKE